jgi:hypothetical protein
MSLRDYALDELTRIGYDPNWVDDDKDAASSWGQGVGDSVMELISVFASQGHSGASAEETLQMFMRVGSFKPLSGITDDEKDWEAVEGIDGPMYQNKRSSNIFKDESGAYQYDFYIFIDPNGSGYTTTQSKKYINEWPYFPTNVNVHVPEGADLTKFNPETGEFDD